MFDVICDVLHREMETIEDKYADGKTPMNGQDLEHIDKMAHALKCLATYEAMKASESGRSRRPSGRYYEPEYRRY